MYMYMYMLHMCVSTIKDTAPLSLLRLTTSSVLRRRAADFTAFARFAGYINFSYQSSS